MVVLLNYALPIVVVLLMMLAFRIKKYWPLVVAILFAIVYQAVQPSYLPKGTVKPLTNAEFMAPVDPVVDRLPKPMSGEDRAKRMKKVEEETSNRIEELRKEARENKNG